VLPYTLIIKGKGAQNMADFKLKGKVFTVDESDIKDIMETEKMDRETAVRCYFEDMGLIDAGEKATITEIASTPQKRRYVKSDKPRKKAERVRKVDEEKKVILEKLMSVIDVEKTVKNEAEFSFNLNGTDYTVKLVKHRPKKGEEGGAK